MVIKELYLVSGIPKCSESIVIKDNSKSALFFDSIKINYYFFNNKYKLTVIFESNF